jgi:chemotaxis protein CheC
MSGPVPELLNEMERDALTELINIGVSRAATNLRTMIGREDRLSVPCVAVAPRQDAAQAIGENSTTRLVAVQQTFEGDFEGRAMMIFPETSSLEVVRAVAADTLPVDDIVALEHEALTETGNIILNSCLATIANMLRRSLRMSLPEIVGATAQNCSSSPTGPAPAISCC